MSGSGSGTPSWEISKENYQPLRSGRKASAVERPVLSSSSQSFDAPMSATKEEARAVKAKIDSFEAALRSYSGTDPLSVWHEYIVWVEQTGRREGNLQTLLEKCIKELKDDARYTQDGRFMDVWAKYANTTDDPIQVFEFMFKGGICTARPELYVNWAWVLEQAGNVKKAERVFKQGVQNVCEEHREDLKKKQNHFQARTMKNIMHEAQQPPPPSAGAGEEERTALAHLRAHGKKTQRVASVRVGSERLSEAPGTMPVATAAASGSTGFKKPLGQKNQGGFQIFSDSGSLPTAAPKIPGQQQQKENALPTDKRRHQENALNPGKWTESKMKRSAPLPAAVSTKPAFSVHQDENMRDAPPPPQQSRFKLESRVLKAKDDGPPVPLAIFEPPDPSKRPMYAKHLVYQGATEFSFEELRAIKIRKRVEEERLRSEKEDLARIASECAEKQSEIKRQQEAFREEQERFAQRQADMLREQERMMLEMQRAQKEEYERQKEELLRLQSQVAQPAAPRGVAAALKDDSSSLMEDTAMLLQAVVNPASSTANRLLSNRSGASGGGSAQNSLQKTPPRCDSAGNLGAATAAAPARAAFIQPSPTVNTREAFKLAQGMWREESVREEAPPPPQNNPAFPIYSDENSAANPPPVINVVPTPASVSKAPFAVFQDVQDTAAKRRRPKLQPRAEDKENELPVSDSMKENEPPAPQVEQAQSTRATAGILQASTNVPFVPLEIQEAVLDEDERRQHESLAAEEEEEDVHDQKTSSFEKMPPPPPALPGMIRTKSNPNATIALPSMEAFEEMAKMASTPYHGRRNFGDDEDDEDDFVDPNTCAVEILFKKPKSKDNPDQEQQEEQHQDQPQQEQERPAFCPLSPLMETSREYKSSSSSGQSLMTTTQNALTKSHWGNTHLGCTTASSMAASSSARTPASSLFLSSNSAATGGGAVMSVRRQMIAAAPARGEMTCSSGYMADSSARTPGNFLVNARKGYHVDEDEEEQDGGAKRAEATPNKGNEKKQKMSYDDDEEEEEMTGIVDMMQMMKRDTKATKAALAAKAKTTAASSFLSVSVNNAAADTSDATGFGGRRNTFLQESLQPSLLDNTGFAELSATKSMLMPVPPQSLGTSMAASFSGHRSPALDMTAPALDVTSPALDVTAPALDESTPTGHDDTTPRDMEEEEEDNAAAAEQVQLEVSRLAISAIDMEEVQDPFDEALQQRLLGQIPTPLWSRHGYHKLSGENLPAVRTHKEVSFGGASFLIGELKAEGAYGKVFKAMKSDNKDETIADMDVVVKIQKPACEWEFYIGTEIHSRLSAMGASYEDKARFMSIPRCFTFEDGSALVSEHQQGTLLDVVNAMASKRLLHEAVAVFFVIEMLVVAQRLRELEIIHGDIKPDNFLLLDMPPVDLSSHATNRDDFFSKLRPSIQLIDFGRCVDLNMFPRGKTFSHVFSKPDLRSPEMLDGKPWSHQIDYFGIASTVYVLLSGSYMKLVKNKDGKNFPSGPMRRWWNGDIWTQFFTEFLNIQSAEELPDLSEWLGRFQDFFFASKLASWAEVHGIIKSALRRS